MRGQDLVRRANELAKISEQIGKIRKREGVALRIKVEGIDKIYIIKAI